MADAHVPWPIAAQNITPARSASPKQQFLSGGTMSHGTGALSHGTVPGQPQGHIMPQPPQPVQEGMREPGSLKDAIAQVAYMRRVMGQLEVGKSMLERELHNTITSRDLLSNELDSLSTLCQQLEQANETKTREKAELEQEVAMLNNMLQSGQVANNEEIERLRGQLDDAIREGSVMSTELQNVQAQQQTTNQLVQEIKASHDRVRELETNDAHMSAQVQELRSIEETQRHQIQELQAAEAHLSTQVQELQRTNAMLNGQLQEMTFNNEQLAKQLGDYQQNTQQLQGQMHELQANLDRAVQENNAANQEKQHLHHTISTLQAEVEAGTRGRHELGDLLTQLMDAAATTIQTVVPKSHPCPTRAEVQHCCNLMTTYALKFDDVRKENNRLQLEVERVLQELNRSRDELKQVKNNAQMKDKAREEEVNSLKRRHSLDVERLQLELERQTQEKRIKEMEMSRQDEATRLLRDQMQQLSAEKERDVNALRMENERELHRIGMESTEKINTMLKDVNSDRLGWEEERAQARQKYEALQRSTEDEVRAQQQKQKQLADHVAGIEAQLMRTTSDLEIAQQEAQTIAAERDVVKMEVENLREQVMGLHSEQGSMQQGVMLAESARDREAAAAAQLREDLAQVEGELTALRESLGAARETLGRETDGARQLRAEVLGLQADLGSVQQKLTFAEQRAALAETARERDVQSGRDMRAEMDEKDEACRRLEQENHGLRDEIGGLQEHIQMLQSDLQNIQVQVQQAQQQIEAERQQHVDAERERELERQQQEQQQQQQQQQMEAERQQQQQMEAERQQQPPPTPEYAHSSRISPQRVRPTNAEHSARQQLATAPIGSAVIVEENVGTVPQSLVGTKGIVIAHAVSPTGEPGCLVGLPPPFGEELVLLANLLVLPKKHVFAPDSTGQRTQTYLPTSGGGSRVESAAMRQPTDETQRSSAGGMTTQAAPEPPMPPVPNSSPAWSRQQPPPEYLNSIGTAPLGTLPQQQMPSIGQWG